jgi:hypothetical protein
LLPEGQTTADKELGLMLYHSLVSITDYRKRLIILSMLTFATLC